MVSLGFSVQAELAHQNQERLPKIKVLGQRAQYKHVHCRGLLLIPSQKKWHRHNFNKKLKFSVLTISYIWQILCWSF